MSTMAPARRARQGRATMAGRLVRESVRFFQGGPLSPSEPTA
ncbi:hypothetical protein B005_1305 [Nocardiopsis alba ATCC BAA-2165]|uniref:Uncharacterized protein n=1 Tax=Nocardiopsis alba (strain ATCC BAA-2165 / BE74) TaxID=1205910 RepID=J7LFQ0_NOCAA|nr:hypothetical protein B005_1305 [Nocardiopsis alba ATCC BAA-2165]